jgi:hypothetical protein
MKSKKSRAWLVIEPAIGVGVAVFLAYEAVRGAVASTWSKL